MQRNIQAIKGNDCVCSYQEQPLCENITCDDQKEGTCKPKEECDKYMNDYKAFTCNDEVCKGNDCECSSEEHQLCGDIRCEDPTEGRCMTT